MTTSKRSPRGGPGRLDLGRVADQGDRQRLAGGGGRPGHAQRLVRVMGQAVDVADLEAPPRPRLVDLDADRHAVVHRHGQGLGAAHPAQAGGQGDPAAQRPAEVLAGQLGERLERALQDALRADVDPRAGGHLAVHRQALALELAEDLPGRPLADQVRVRDQDPGRPFVGPEDRDRLARLDEQRLVVGEAAELADDRVEGLPASGRPAGAAVDDERVGVLGDLGVEVVHQHPQGRFLAPAAAGQLRAAGRPDGTRSGKRRATGECHRRDSSGGLLGRAEAGRRVPSRSWASSPSAAGPASSRPSASACSPARPRQIFEPGLMASIEAIFRDVAERGDRAVLDATARFDEINSN